MLYCTFTREGAGRGADALTRDDVLTKDDAFTKDDVFTKDDACTGKYANTREDASTKDDFLEERRHEFDKNKKEAPARPYQEIH